MERHDGGVLPDERGGADEQREARLGDVVEDFEILPDSTMDDTDAGWGERAGGNDARLLAERPPHWG